MVSASVSVSVRVSASVSVGVRVRVRVNGALYICIDAVDLVADEVRQDMRLFPSPFHLFPEAMELEPSVLLHHILDILDILGIEGRWRLT